MEFSSRLREIKKIKGKKGKKHRHFGFIPPRAETTTSPTRRSTATSRPSGATCAGTAAAWIDSSVTGQRCTGQHGTTTGRSSRSSWRRAPPWTSWAAEAVGSSAIAAGAHGAASATPPVLRSDSAARCSTQRPRGVRPAAAGSKGLPAHWGQRRLGASADVVFLKTVFFSPAVTRTDITDITAAVQRMWHVSMTYDLWHIF